MQASECTSFLLNRAGTLGKTQRRHAYLRVATTVSIIATCNNVALIWAPQNTRTSGSREFVLLGRSKLGYRICGVILRSGRRFRLNLAARFRDSLSPVDKTHRGGDLCFLKEAEPPESAKRRLREVCLVVRCVFVLVDPPVGVLLFLK